MKQLSEVKKLQKIAGILKEDLNMEMPAKRPSPAILVLDPDGSVSMFKSLSDFMDNTGNEGAEIDYETPITAEEAKSFGIEGGIPNNQWNRVIDKFAGRKFYETMETQDEGIVIAVV